MISATENFTRWFAMTVYTDEGDNTDGTNREAAADSSDTEAGTFDTTLPRSLSLTTAWDESHAWVASDGTFTVPLTLARPSPRARVEVIEDDLPILAHRAAALRFGGDNRHWMSVTNSYPFGIDADAECTAVYAAWGVTSATHPVPSQDCTCGFYACPLGVNNEYATPSNVTLLVELSGDVIECERKYRAGHQRVIECQLPRCPYCAAEATLLRAKGGRLAAVACSSRHLEGGKGVTLTVDELRELIGVPVTARPYT